MGCGVIITVADTKEQLRAQPLALINQTEHKKVLQTKPSRVNILLANQTQKVIEPPSQPLRLVNEEGKIEPLPLVQEQSPRTNRSRLAEAPKIKSSGDPSREIKNQYQEVVNQNNSSTKRSSSPSKLAESAESKRNKLSPENSLSPRIHKLEQKQAQIQTREQKVEPVKEQPLVVQAEQAVAKQPPTQGSTLGNEDKTAQKVDESRLSKRTSEESGHRAMQGELQSTLAENKSINVLAADKQAIAQNKSPNKEMSKENKQQQNETVKKQENKPPTERSGVIPQSSKSKMTEPQGAKAQDKSKQTTVQPSKPIINSSPKQPPAKKVSLEGQTKKEVQAETDKNTDRKHIVQTTHGSQPTKKAQPAVSKQSIANKPKANKTSNRQLVEVSTLFMDTDLTKHRIDTEMSSNGPFKENIARTEGGKGQLSSRPSSRQFKNGGEVKNKNLMSVLEKKEADLLLDSLQNKEGTVGETLKNLQSSQLRGTGEKELSSRKSLVSRKELKAAELEKNLKKIRESLKKISLQQKKKLEKESNNLKKIYNL